MSIDQKAKIANVEDVNKPDFRCYLCGHHFNVGDQWRWVAASGFGLANFLVCAKCDGPDVLERWKQQNEEAGNRFWWFAKKV